MGVSGLGLGVGFEGFGVWGGLGLRVWGWSEMFGLKVWA